MIFRKATIRYFNGFNEVRYFSSEDGYKNPITMIRFRTFAAAHVSATLCRQNGGIKGSGAELMQVFDEAFRIAFGGDDS